MTALARHGMRDLARLLPKPRGKLFFDAALAPLTWFRVGGAADVLFQPADEADLADFLAALPTEVPVTVLGVGSNLLVRDGGVRGVVVRLTQPFGAVAVEEGARLRCGAGALDAVIAREAQRAGLAGLEFLSGIPGTIGGGLVMNAGAYGREFKDVLGEARALTRDGSLVTLVAADMGFGYRTSAVPEDLIFMGALLHARPGAPDAIAAEMERIARAREASQPIRTRTSGSTFKNPQGSPRRAWQLIDEAGCRGLSVGDAQVSELHCNFLINRGNARASDLEALGELVRSRVRAATGVALEWEIKRIGEEA